MSFARNGPLLFFAFASALRSFHQPCLKGLHRRYATKLISRHSKPTASSQSHSDTGYRMEVCPIALPTIERHVRKDDNPPNRNVLSPPQKPYRQMNSFTPAQASYTFAPKTKFDLAQEIRRLLLLNPPPPLSRLLSLHRRYPHLQSTESYNVLIALSIRLNTYYTTRSLLSSMADHNVSPNEETEKYVIRYNVSAGFWVTAWRQVLARYSKPAYIPVPVLLELLASSVREYALPRFTRPNKRHRRLNRRALKRSPPVPLVRPPRRLVPIEPLRLILLRFPSLASGQITKLPLLVVSYIVRALLRFNREEPAILMTKRQIEGQPSNLTKKRISFLQNLINTHLSVGQVKLANHKKYKRMVEEMFQLHPQLTPNAKTTSLLMRYMAKSHRCGIEAYLFYKSFKARWGPHVDSLDVRARIMKYALKQRKLGIANEVARLPPIPEKPREKVDWNPRKLIPLRSFSEIFSQTGRSRHIWSRVTEAVFIQRRNRLRYLQRKRKIKRGK